MADDYYQILGVSQSASGDEIQKAYRKLARKYHPDLHADKDEKERGKAKQHFQKVQQAYDVLSDKKKREMYDQFGPGYEQMAGQGSPFGQSGGAEIDFSQIFGRGGGRGSGAGGFGGFEDILRQMGGAMGGGRGGFGGQAPPPAKGEDVEQQITIPFAVAVLGGNHQIQLSRPSGKVESIDIKIPAGIETGKKIRLRGQGHPSRSGGPAGDLLITVKIAKHPCFTRNGLNLGVTLPVTLQEAAGGTQVDLATAHGTVSLKVPPGTSSGKNLRLKGLGVKTKDRAGDLIVTIQIMIPADVSSDDLQALKALSPPWSQPVREGLSW